MNNNYRINLGNYGLLQPGEVKYAEYKPRELNTAGILAQGRAEYNQRRNNSLNMRKELNTSLGLIKNTLDSSQREWFDDYANKTMKQFNSAIANNDYTMATDIGTDIGGKFTRDNELLARQDFSNIIKQKKEEATKIPDLITRERVQSQLNDATSLNNIFSQNYNAEKGFFSTPEFAQYSTDDYSFNVMLAKAGGVINADQTNSSVTSGQSGDKTDDKGNITGNFSKSSTRASSFSQVTEAEIWRNLEEFVRGNPRVLQYWISQIQDLQYIVDKGDKIGFNNLTPMEQAMYNQGKKTLTDWTGSSTYTYKDKNGNNVTVNNAQIDADYVIRFLKRGYSGTVKSFAYTHKSSTVSNEIGDHTNNNNGKYTVANASDGSIVTLDPDGHIVDIVEGAER